MDGIKSSLITEGYFETPRFLSKVRNAKMLSAVNQVRAAGWPVPFVFIYDAFWQAPRGLQYLLDEILGPDFKLLPDFWAWFIDHQHYESGWRRHRDRDADCIREDGLPESLTVWIALTEASVDNGCIYVLPASKDPRYRKDFRSQAIDNPRDVRPLECSAGTLIAWNQVILHWGGKSHPQAKNSRVSFAYEFQSKDVPAHNVPLLNPLSPPTFTERLALIAKQVLQYQHMYLLSDEMTNVANDVVTSCALPTSV